ncbi:GNAT family N-acetyltransferase [Allorhizobium sp. BGMRC 0089]|uniref:GNAT family N-acetyltransferase n=1 Tax=Allorhizobium sonneratiae TaxID=2934936 RepID=UPI002033276F|nr:GNAT family N-acetyltransferase [Allorhizobium sonneratiae]
MILETERLILLPWERDDARLIASLHDSERTSRFVSTRKPWSLDYASHRMQGWLDEFETDGTGKMKILNKADGRFIGRAGFSRSKEHGSGYELGYSIAEKEWGKGFATEIARGLSRWFFETQRGDHFIAFAHVDNAASLAVLRKIATKDLGVAEHKGDPFHFFETVRTSIAENDF